MSLNARVLEAMLGGDRSFSEHAIISNPAALAVWDSQGSVDFFKTTFRVPERPSQDDGQGIFLSPAAQPSPKSGKSVALKPVLEWGPTATGGTSAWSVQSYYIDGSPSRGMNIGAYSNRQVVLPGEELIAIIKLRDKRKIGTRDSYFYTCEFDGISGTFLGVDLPEPLTEFGVVLQIFGASSCRNLPVGSPLKFKTEFKAGANVVSPSWHLTSANECGTSIASSPDGSEIDISYNCAAAS